MNKFIVKGTFVILALLNTKAFAAEMDNMYYWTNAKGLVRADNCKLESARNPKLGFIKGSLFSNTVTLERSQGQSNLKIVAGSLVKLGEIESAVQKRGVGVVGVNALYAALETEAVRTDSGYVNVKNIESITNNFIQLKNENMNAPGGTFWKVFGKEKFLKMTCPGNGKDYLVFNVYPENGGRVFARVGVSSSETDVFKNITTYKESKIYNKFSDTVTDETNSLSEIDSLPETAHFDTRSEVVTPSRPEVKNPVRPEVPTKEEPKYNYQEVSTQTGSETIICTDQSYINVRNEDLSQVLFTTKTGDRVKLFQGWGNNKFEGSVNGKSYVFSKVEFLDSEDYSQRIGYVVSSYVEPKSNCIYDRTYRDSLKPANTTFTGLDDKDCCNFPTIQKVTTSFTDGMRRFGGSRGGGSRAHAAADLYRYIDEPIFSVAPGVVIRGLYYFYQDTFALEVLHSGGFVVRYGELTGKMVYNISMGKQVEMGDRLGFIGKVNSGCCEPMLHFELYSGALKGPLTQDGAEVNGVLYNRRRDLINPTKYLLKWQNAKF